MERISKTFLAIAIIVFNIALSYAQDKEDAIDYEPIHTTYYPGDGRLNIPEQDSKFGSVMCSGDDLLITAIKGHTATVSFPLPINPFQDYTIELTMDMDINKFSSYTWGTRDVFVSITGKFLTVVNSAGENLYTNKKWALPKGDVNNQVVCKLQRRKKNTIIYINDQYICETVVSRPKQEFAMVFSVLSNKKGVMTLKAIKVEQGEENDK